MKQFSYLPWSQQEHYNRQVLPHVQKSTESKVQDPCKHHGEGVASVLLNCISDFSQDCLTLGAKMHTSLKVNQWEILSQKYNRKINIKVIV